MLAEKALRKAHDNLENVVEKRTLEMLETNAKLRRELKNRKQAEKALLESEQRYRAVVESQTELICRFLSDGRLTFVNDAYSRFFGKKPAELIGQSFLNHVPQEDLEKVEKHLASINRDNPIATIKHRVKQPDGAIRWQQWIDRAIFDDQGRVKEYQSVGRDITKQVQAQKAVQEREQLLQNVFDSIQDGIIDEIKKQIPESKIKYVKKNEDPRDYRVDFSKIKRELGSNITKTVPDGIKEIKDVIELGIISDPENQKYYNIPRKT